MPESRFQKYSYKLIFSKVGKAVTFVFVTLIKNKHIIGVFLKNFDNSCTAKHISNFASI